MVKVYQPPEVYTSYFGRVPALLRNGFAREEMASICLRRMKYIDKRIHSLPAVAPFPALLEGYQKGLIDEFSYRVLYRDWLDLHIDADKLIDEIRRAGLKVFLCYEANGKFCHRHVFAEWLSAHGLQCEEWAPTFTYQYMPARRKPAPPPALPPAPPPPPPAQPTKWFQPSLF